MGIDVMMRGMVPYKSPRNTRSNSLATGESAGIATIEGDDQAHEITSVSYLTVPKNTLNRRPSTADRVIEKLKVERVDGGGLTVSGVAIGANCHLTLVIFGSFFILAGIVLTYVGFARSKSGQSLTTDKAVSEPVSAHRNMKIIGPLFISAGTVMVFFGLTIFGFSRKIKHDDKLRRRFLSEIQLGQLESSFNCENNSSPILTAAPSIHESYPVMSVRRGSWWVDPASNESVVFDTGGYEEAGCFSRSSRTPSPINSSPYNYAHQFSSSEQEQIKQAGPPLLINSSLVETTFPEESKVRTDIATFPPEEGETQGSPFDTTVYFSGHKVTVSQQHRQENDHGTVESQETPVTDIQLHSLHQEWRRVSSTSQVPMIQVTPTAADSLVNFPRLSRHSGYSTPTERTLSSSSRPTTAERS